MKKIVNIEFVIWNGSNHTELVQLFGSIVKIN